MTADNTAPTTRDQAAWRKAIADQVRANCTLNWEIMQRGGDRVILGVANWIENPPEWSTFQGPESAPTTPDLEQRLYHAIETEIVDNSRVLALGLSERVTDAALSVLGAVTGTPNYEWMQEVAKGTEYWEPETGQIAPAALIVAKFNEYRQDSIELWERDHLVGRGGGEANHEQ